MEKKIGEVFELDNLKLKCIKASNQCDGCYFNESVLDCSEDPYYGLTECNKSWRKDQTDVIFVELKSKE